MKSPRLAVHLAHPISSLILYFMVLSKVSVLIPSDPKHSLGQTLNLKSSLNVQFQISRLRQNIQAYVEKKKSKLLLGTN